MDDFPQGSKMSWGRDYVNTESQENGTIVMLLKFNTLLYKLGPYFSFTKNILTHYHGAKRCIQKTSINIHHFVNIIHQAGIFWQSGR